MPIKLKQTRFPTRGCHELPRTEPEREERCWRISVAAQEETIAGCSSQTVAESPDARAVLHRAALANITLTHDST